MASDYREPNEPGRVIGHGHSGSPSAADQHQSRATPGLDRAPDTGQQHIETKRGLFATFRPQMPVPEPKIDRQQASERSAVPNQLRGTPERAAERDAAIGRYGRALTDIGRMHARHLPVLPEQERAQEKSRAGLDAVRPQMAADMESALAHDPSLIRDATSGRTNRVIRALQVEAEIRTNPALRADRFVSEWQELSRARSRMEQAYDFDGAKAVRTSMAGIAKSLERDPQMESILRNRKIELGLQMSTGRNIGADLMDQLGLGRSRGLGL